MDRLPKIVFSLALAIVAALMVYIILTVLATPQTGWGIGVSGPVDWRPPVEDCPEHMTLWDCVRTAAYKGAEHGTP